MNSNELLKQYIDAVESEIFAYVKEEIERKRVYAASFFNGKVFVDYGELVGEAEMSLTDMINDYLESVEAVGTGKIYIGDIDDVKLLRNNLMQCVEMLDRAIEEVI